MNLRRVNLPILAVLFLSGCGSTLPLPGERPPLTDRQRDAALKALLGQDDYAEYVLIADTLESAEWLRKFWVSHDPTPASTENEFKDEHERRVYHAIYLFGSHSGGPPWDERGEVYIRYGQPDERLIRRGVDDDPTSAFRREQDDRFDDPLDNVNAATEVWTYYRWNQTFQFEDKRGWDSFEMVPVTDPFSERQDLAEFYQNRLRAVDLQPAIYYHEYGRNLIDYSLDVVRFRGEDGNWRVDINLGYPLSELERAEDSVSITIQRTVIVRDDEQRDVYAEGGRIQRIVGNQSDNRLMVEQKVLDLAPGAYALIVRVDDLISGKSGTYIKNFRLPEFIVPEVQEISDIELASYVWSIFEPGASFVKSDRVVVPLPSRVYLPGQPLSFYFEVYNLLLNDDGQSHFSISYEISGIERREKKSYDAAHSGPRTGNSRHVSHVDSFDIDDLAAGEYVLTVRVNDLLGKHEKTTAVQFKKSG